MEGWFSLHFISFCTIWTQLKRKECTYFMISKKLNWENIITVTKLRTTQQHLLVKCHADFIANSMYDTEFDFTLICQRSSPLISSTQKRDEPLHHLVVAILVLPYVAFYENGEEDTRPFQQLWVGGKSTGRGFRSSEFKFWLYCATPNPSLNFSSIQFLLCKGGVWDFLREWMEVTNRRVFFCCK